jgi:hypothetical protein
MKWLIPRGYRGTDRLGPTECSYRMRWLLGGATKFEHSPSGTLEEVFNMTLGGIFHRIGLQ